MNTATTQTMTVSEIEAIHEAGGGTRAIDRRAAVAREFTSSTLGELRVLRTALLTEQCLPGGPREEELREFRDLCGRAAEELSVHLVDVIIEHRDTSSRPRVR